MMISSTGNGKWQRRILKQILRKSIISDLSTFESSAKINKVGTTTLDGIHKYDSDFLQINNIQRARPLI